MTLHCLVPQATMYKAAQVAPTVLIPGGNRTVLQSWEVSLRGSASFPSPYMYNSSTLACEPISPTNRPLNFEWSADPAGPNFEFQALPAAYQATQLSAQLTIPADFLQASAFVLHDAKKPESRHLCCHHGQKEAVSALVQGCWNANG